MFAAYVEFAPKFVLVMAMRAFPLTETFRMFPSGFRSVSVGWNEQGVGEPHEVSSQVHSKKAFLKMSQTDSLSKMCILLNILSKE